MKQGKNGTILSYTLLVVTFVIWGSLYVASKTALADLSPTALLFFRYFLGLFPLFVLYRREKKQTRIRRGDWKAVRYNVLKGGGIQLYNLAEDPGETRDLAAEYPEMVEEFDSLMRSSRTESALFRFGAE